LWCRPVSWRWCPRRSSRGAARCARKPSLSAMLGDMARIAIVGGGSIGEALLSGLLRAGRQVKDLVVAEKMPDRARYLAETYSVLVTSVHDAVENATFVIIAVKPSDVPSVVGEITRLAAESSDEVPEQVLITVAAGVTTAYLESKLTAGTPVVRVMPNAPALVGAGISAIAKGRFATNEQLKEVAALFDSVGAVLTVPEDQLDAVTAVSGSGPAYFFLMVEALIDAAVGAGLSRSVSTELVAQTIAGSAAMLLDRIEQDRGTASDTASDLSLDTTAARLRAVVTSPGGTTAAALRELEDRGLRGALYEAVRAAKTRSEQLRITSE
jgi:pyrroline-5-carboxylate reductase